MLGTVNYDFQHAPARSSTDVPWQPNWPLLIERQCSLQLHNWTATWQEPNPALLAPALHGLPDVFTFYDVSTQTLCIVGTTREEFAVSALAAARYMDGEP